MATRAPLREGERSFVEHESHHGLLGRAEEWAEETGLAAQGEPAAGVPWHLVLLVVAGLALLFVLEMTVVLAIVKLVTGRAY